VHDRHRDEDDEDTKEIPVVEHRHYGLKWEPKSKTYVMDETSWKTCTCSIGVNHT
jgi:hypothetical protein